MTECKPRDVGLGEKVLDKPSANKLGCPRLLNALVWSSKKEHVEKLFEAGMVGSGNLQSTYLSWGFIV